MSRSLKLLSVATTAVMYLVLMMGALVTNSGSADGCGSDWPLCNDSFLPALDYHAIIEWSHRAVTGVVGFMVLALAIWAWRALPHNKAVKWMSGLSLFTLVLQSGLGAAAVVWPQPKYVLALHMGISLVCFSAVLLLAVMIHQADKRAEELPAVDPAFQRWVWTVTGFTYLVVYLGAYVRHMKASMACLGWPLCNGQLIPPLYGEVGIVFLHRVGALLAVLMVVRMLLLARRFAAQRPDLRRAAGIALGLVLAQSASGALFPFGYVNIATQELHTAIMTALWGVLSYLCLAVLPAAASGRIQVQAAGDRRPAVSH